MFAKSPVWPGDRQRPFLKKKLVIDNDGHCGDDGNEESDHNDDDNLVEHDLPSRRMEVDRKNNPSQLPIKWHNFPATEDRSVMMIYQ